MSSATIVYAFSLISWSASRFNSPMASLAQSSLAQLGLRTVKSATAYEIDPCRRDYECSHTVALVEQMRRRSPPSARTIARKPPSSPDAFRGHRPAVCGLGFVAYRMLKSAFAMLRRQRADFRSPIRKRRSEPVRGYRPSPVHGLPQHEHRLIGQWSAGLLTGKTN
jgi:hypothetical protein